MNKMKNNFKMWLIPLLLIMVMVGCDERVGLTSPPDLTKPTVSSTNPVDLSTGVAFNNKITATFSEVMDSATITTATFTLMQGSSFVSGAVSYIGTTATFAPSSFLSPNTLYIATITTMAKNLLGSGLANNYVWSFTTGAAATVTPPTVSSTAPNNADTGVPINQKIAASFSVAMDASTITAATFTLLQGITPVPGFVSYSGITAIFAPSSNLTPNTAYTAMITTGAKDLAGIALVNNYVWSFTTGAGVIITPPTVLSTIPANGDLGVALNQKIAANFSTTMDASTITASTFTLKQGTTPVSGFVSYSGSTAIFAPSANLSPNTLYTATITTGAKDLAGNALASNYGWTFTTGAAVIVTPPTVTLTEPVNLATGVALNQNITATFSTIMDASTITTATFTLMQGTTFVSGTLSYVGKVATYNPSTNLAPLTTYTATVTTGAKDLAGNALATNYVWSFTTGAGVLVIPPTVLSTAPANGDIGVALNQKIAANFSTPMDASTITASTFILMQGTTPVSGFVSYSGSTAIFAPSANLSPNTLYTATVTTGAMDLASNALASDYVWTFTTGSAVVIIPPTVTLTDPLDLATGVALNQNITATFSTIMDASTITTATFTLMQGTTFVSGTLSYAGKIATYNPSTNLAPLTTYTATITTGAKDLAGNSMASNYVWTFTTGAGVVVTLPTVLFTDPLPGAIGVVLNKQISATFSWAMDASTISTSTFTLMQGSTPIQGFVSYSGTKATFAPTTNLAPLTTYTATITTGAKDLAGNALASNYVWTFTTEAAVVIVPPTVTLTDPLNLATGVALNKQITATFSKTMDASTISTSTFTLMQGSTPVQGFVSYSGTKATFAPVSNLTANTTYTATITTGAKDTAGIALASNHVWTFTTVIPYTVTLQSNPLLGGTLGGVGFISGIGTFNSGSSVTVTASANAGYTFNTWTENGNVVSILPDYQFTISSNRTLVANFTLTTGYKVVLESNPVGAGNLYGAGTFNLGDVVTVSTSSKSGYQFVNLTEKATGNIVSTNASMTFTITGDTTIVANFVLGMAGIDLGSAGDFAILAGSGVSNTGLTTVYGDVGAFPTATINGFPPGVVVGTLYTAADPLVGTAKGALTTAYNEAQGRSLNAISLPGQIGGLTLTPGLYVNGSSSGISGTGPQGILTLDAKGDVNAVWVFKMSSTFITDAGTSVVLAGGAQWQNIYWSVGTSATLGTTSIFYGNILADQSITLTTGATLRGRALTRIAAVTLDANTVDKRP